MSNACGNNAVMVITQFNTTDITSPNWPNPYPPNTSCMWEIITTDGAAIQLSLKGYKLDLEYVYLHFYLGINID